MSARGLILFDWQVSIISAANWLPRPHVITFCSRASYWTQGLHDKENYLIFHKHSCVIYLQTKEELEAHRVINTASAFISTYWKVFKNIVQIKYFRKIDKICAEFYKFFSGIKIDWNCFWQYVLTCILRIGCLSHDISWWYCFGVSSEVSLEFLQLNQKIKNIYYCTWLLLLLQ